MEDNEIFENLTQALWAYGEEVKQLYQKRLLADGKKATGDLINNIQVKVAYQGLYFVVYLELEDYFKFVEEGAKAHWPPKQAILNWINVKPILPTPDEKGHLPTPDTLAFLIGRAMAGKSPNQENLKNPEGGILPGYQLRDTIEAVNRYYLPILQEALEKDFDSYSIKIYETINKMVQI